MNGFKDIGFIMQKTRKRFDGEQEKSIDRLPDEILVHILSFMSTKQCVRSSILGKRWRFLWSRVPNLKFDSGDHQTVRSFSNFVYRFVFIHEGHNINTFRIQLKDDHMESSEYNKFEIETLFAAAIGRNVKVIEIHSGGFELVWPQCLFTCKTLADLALNCICENNVPMVPMAGINVYLPALKKLELRNVRFESEEPLVHLLSGCPALEELTIDKGVDKAVCVYVSSPTLTRLDLEIDGQTGDDDDITKDFEVKLDTPALKYLRLHDSLSRDFSVGMLVSLSEADIYFYDHALNFDVLYSRSVLEFVGNLNNVICLKITTGLIQVPDSGLTTEFRNLTKLEFRGDCNIFTNFLENSDNLKVLTIGEVNGFRDWMEPKQVPMCMKYHLGTVRFVEFGCSEKEFNMVEYILRNAKVLKRMEIRMYYDDLNEKDEALKRISLFERASEACQVDFD